MLRILADGKLAYDSRLENYTLLGLKTTTGLNKGGTAEIVMPPGHPAYNMFTSYRTVVELYENGVLRFRGRSLYPSDDFYNTRTITCEGERCFFRDAIMRPYLYQDSPAAIFTAALELYNAAVDEFKQFRLGEITVTDANNYVRFEGQSAVTFAEFFDKLVERCGGFIVFRTDENGDRVADWLATIDTQSDQAIEFGENLLEFARSGQSDDLATAILPYGAQLEDGTRVTIESVTDNGLDYIQDDEAVALRGRIMATVTWDDVTDPENLLDNAKAWLAEHKLAVTSLQLTAADLSRMDKSIGSYHVGNYVKVRSKPHGVDDYFQLTERTVDWLDPAGGNITMGRAQATLTGADAIYKQMASQAASQVKTEAIKQSNTNSAAQVEQAKQEMSSEIKQLAGSISLEVSGGLGNLAAIRLTVDGDSITQSLDLSNVRKSFADDSTAVSISAGTITFNSGTIVINSEKFKVDAAGKITATDAVIHGDIITIDGSYKTEMDRGSLRLYYSDTLCGTINTKYWTGASSEGISLRIEEGGKYIMFSHPSDAATGYDVDYYLNYGWSTNYAEKHIFQTSARFLEKVYFSGSGAYFRSAYLYENSFIRSVKTDGTVGEEMLGFSSSRVNVGSVGCATMLRGTTVYLKDTSTTVTSDRNAKNSIEALPENYEAFLDALQPVRFKYNEGRSGRYHVGYIAQEVAEALSGAGLTTQDFAGYVDIEGGGGLGLMYDEFVALLHLKIKRLEQCLAALTVS